MRTPRDVSRNRRPGPWLRVLVLFLACGAASLQAAGGDPAVAAGPVPVFVTVVPLATFVERIGGDQVRVRALVHPGQNPHAYEPSPRQVAELSDAELYVRLGLPLEDAWLPRIRAVNPGLVVLDARDGIRLRPSDPVGTLAGAPAVAYWGQVTGRDGDVDHDHDHDHDHDNDNDNDNDNESDGDHGHGHEHGAWDSHIWTSPPLAKAIGAAIRDALSARRPAQAARFAANYDAFAADLDALDQELRERLAPVKERRFLVFHPAWGYFADTYGLTQVAIEYEGKEPGPRALAGLIEAARAAGVRTVLVQPQFSPRAAEQVAAAIGGRVAAVDPLSPDYFGTLRWLADLIAGGKAR